MEQSKNTCRAAPSFTFATALVHNHSNTPTHLRVACRRSRGKGARPARERGKWRGNTASTWPQTFGPRPQGAAQDACCHASFARQQFLQLCHCFFSSFHVLVFVPKGLPLRIASPVIPFSPGHTLPRPA